MRTSCFVLCATVVALPGLIAAQTDSYNTFQDNIFIEQPLDAQGYQMAYSKQRDYAVVSVPGASKLQIFSTRTGQHVRDVTFDEGLPFGVDVSIDGSTAYAALRDTGTVAAIDLATFDTTYYDVSADLGELETFSVKEVEPGRLFVTGLSSFAVQLNTDTGATSRIMDGRHFGSPVYFHRDPTGQYVYGGRTRSPNDLYKMELSDPAAGVILEDVHGEITGGSRYISITSDGERMFLAGGQAVSTSDFTEIWDSGLMFGWRVNDLSIDDRYLYSLTDQFMLIHDAQTYELKERIFFNSPFALPSFDFFLTDGDENYISLHGDRFVLSIPAPSGVILCGIAACIGGIRQRK